MKALIAVGLSVLLASPLALLALESMGVGPDFEASAPQWKAGYNWEWDVTGRMRASGEALGMATEAETLRSEATRRAEVLNTTLEQNGTPLRAVLEAFRLERILYGDEVQYDAADHRPDEDPGDGDFGDLFFCMTPCGTMLALYTEDGNPYAGTEAKEFLGSDRVHLLDFPMDRGKTWKVVSIQEDDELFFEIEAEAVTNEYVNLDGFAPFHSVRIEASLSEATKEAMKRMVQAGAEEEGYRADIDFDIKMVYWYAPEAQNIIKIDLDGFMSIRVSGYGTAGSGRVDFHLDQVLSDYSLKAGPEQTMEQALARAEAAWANGGDAALLSDETFDFQVGADALSVRAHEDGAVFFGPVTGAQADAADEEPQVDFVDAPEGSTVKWTHRYQGPNGVVTERATGATTRFEMTEPGLHTVSAQVLDAQGRLMGADHVIVEAYTEETVRQGAPAGVFGVTGGMGTPLRVAEGATSFQVLLDPDGVASGELFVANEDDDWSSDGRTLTGPETIDLSHRTPSEYIVMWRDDARAAPMEMTITVRYDRTGAVPELPDNDERAQPIWAGPSWLQRLA